MKQFNFGEALEKLKEGKPVFRLAWVNQHIEYIYMVPKNRYKAMTDVAKEIADEMDDKVSYKSYIAYKTGKDEEGLVGMWTPLNEDILSEDWCEWNEFNKPVLLDSDFTLKDTIEMMKSKNYKERFKAEYLQLDIRYKKLEQMLINYEAGTLNFTPSCGIEILQKQLRSMKNYLYYLKVRAKIEQIDLVFNKSTDSKSSSDTLDKESLDSFAQSSILACDSTLA